MPVQYAGNGWLLVGDALRSCVNTGISVRGMDMALTGAQAAARLCKTCPLAPSDWVATSTFVTNVPNATHGLGPVVGRAGDGAT